jgi:nucleotide-binding universal stress UspA family protein
MKDIKKIIVGLELNHTDTYILNYLKKIAFYLNPEEIKFINIHKEELPLEIAEKFPEIIDNIDEHYIKEMVEETINISVLDTETSYQAIQGSVLEEILNAANQPEVDLLVIGRKNEIHKRHLHYKKIIRKAVSSILIIPESSPTTLNKLLVPIDFSNYSKFSLELAIDLAESSKSKLIIQYIYEVPTGYSKTGKTFLDFAKIMEQNAKERCENFLSEIKFKGIEYELIYSLSESGSTSKTIEDTITDSKADLLILGSKGKNKFSAMLVGSTAESLIGKRDLKIPLLLTRMKAHSTSIWEALKEF